MIDLMPLARFLFDRQADSYDADPAMRELAWSDVLMQNHWLEEAAAIHEFLFPADEGA